MGELKYSCGCRWATAGNQTYACSKAHTNEAPTGAYLLDIQKECDSCKALTSKLETVQRDKDLLQWDNARLGEAHDDDHEQIVKLHEKIRGLDLQVGDLTKNLETVTQQREAMRTEVQVYQLEVERLKEDVAHWEKQFGHASEHVDELEAKLTGEKDLCIRAIECSSRIGRAMEDCLAAMGRAYGKLEWMKGEDVVDCKSQIKAAGERGRVALRGTVSRDTEKRPCPKCGFWNCEESCLAPGRVAENRDSAPEPRYCVKCGVRQKLSDAAHAFICTATKGDAAHPAPFIEEDTEKRKCECPGSLHQPSCPMMKI